MYGFLHLTTLKTFWQISDLSFKTTVQYLSSSVHYVLLMKIEEGTDERKNNFTVKNATDHGRS